MSSESEQTAAELADLTLDDFKTWTTINLKASLHLRGKNSAGGQESLAAKAFSARSDKVPVKVPVPDCFVISLSDIEPG